MDARYCELCGGKFNAELGPCPCTQAEVTELTEDTEDAE